MKSAFIRFCFGILGLMLLQGSEAARAQSDALKRYAIVIGNSAYQYQALQSSAAQDAVQVANALAARGFEVIGARDISQAQLAATLSDLNQRLSPTRDNNIVVVYLAGRFVQVANQNFFLPVDYEPVLAVELGKVGLRISDFQVFLSTLAAKGQAIFLDSGNSIPVTLDGFKPVAGLAVSKPVRNSLIGMNTTAGILGADYLDPIGPYARALSEAILRGAKSWTEFSDFVRLRQLQITRGDTLASFSVNWDRAPILFAPGQDPIKNLSVVRQMAMQESPKASFAFTLALARGTSDALDEFNFLYPTDPLLRRSKLILSAMREARIWTQVLDVDKPEAYWAYLNIYSRGGHSDEARYRLKLLKAPAKPPQDSALLTISNPPSTVDEADLVIKYSPIALDDERLRLPSAILPVQRFIGPIADRIQLKPVQLNKKTYDLPVIAGQSPVSGKILLPNLEFK